MSRAAAWWEPFGGSVQGSAHVHAGLPNQDAWAATAAGPCAAVAVADGHGSRRCPRAATGARLAVSIAVDVAASVCRPDDTDPADRLTTAVGPAIVDAWREAVHAHLEASPFTPAEAATSDPDVPELAYGTTVVVVVTGLDSVSALGIGDGDVVALRPGGEALLVLGGGGVGTETASLAQPDALSSLDVAVVPGPVAAVWASTDGFGAAFESRRWWRDVAGDLDERLRTLTSAELAARLPGWLEEPASVGGDDATMALLVRRATYDVGT